MKMLIYILNIKVTLNKYISRILNVKQPYTLRTLNYYRIIKLK